MRRGAATWLLTWTSEQPDTVTAKRISGAEAARSRRGGELDGAVQADPVIDTVALSSDGASGIVRAVKALGPVYRVRNGDLWDAIGTAIIRQVIRAAQARQMYARFCLAHGSTLATQPGSHHLFPSPERVLDLSTADFDELRMGFKQPPLTAAATAFLKNRATWEQLDPSALVAALQAVPRIGPWTAGAAVADWSGDFSVYPYADLAVRTWARRAAPTTAWPEDEPRFAACWREIAGDELSALTQLVLAWGGTHVGSP
jgi:DNA-3-methyladenine glycosylase II